MARARSAQRTLVTERLRLEPLDPCHAEAVAGLFVADPALSAYLQTDATQPAQAQALVSRWLEHRSGPLGHWVFWHSGALIGVGHLRPSPDLPAQLPEMGWYLTSRYQGRGLATEATRALLDHGLRELRLTSVWALVHEANQPSLRLAQRLGFLQVGSTFHYGAMHRVHVALPGVTPGPSDPLLG
jgi:[ribosomal protein S5]-alanine N-acetyltransferase